MECTIKFYRYKVVEMILFLLLSLLSILVFISIRLPTLSVGLLIVAIIIIFPSRNVVSKINAILYFLIILILIQGGIVAFNFIPQAETLLQINTDLIFWFSRGHPHAIRLLIAYPGYLLSQLYAVDLEVGFSYYASAFFTLMYLIIMETTSKFPQRARLPLAIKGFIAIAPFIFLLFIMNGRLIFAYTGFSILINLFLGLFRGEPKSKLKLFVSGLFGFLLTTVSSGTMTVSLSYLVLLTCILNRKKMNKWSFIKRLPKATLLLAPLLYIILPYFWMMLMRNVNFFGGGISGVFNMLNHGAGRIFGANNAIILVMAFVPIAIYINVRYLKKAIENNYNLIPILCAINIAIYGLMFGFSTGLMMIPPIIMLVLVKL